MQRESKVVCPEGKETAKRKFFLLGPEGVKELNPNDRLVMAMYTDAKPLISTLNQLAGQKANAEAKKILPFDLLLHQKKAEKALNLIQETSNAAKADGSDKKFDKETIANLTKNILKTLGVVNYKEIKKPTDREAANSANATGLSILGRPQDSSALKKSQGKILNSILVPKILQEKASN